MEILPKPDSGMGLLASLGLWPPSAPKPHYGKMAMRKVLTPDQAEERGIIRRESGIIHIDTKKWFEFAGGSSR